MKNFGVKVLFVAFGFVLIQGCGESEEERLAREQARMDSLRQVQQQQIAEQMAAMQDSLDAAGVTMEEATNNSSPSNPQGQEYTFVENGSYAVQVGAFRSEEKANSFIAKWSDRDYPSAYVVKVGDEQWGDVWFRVRVGFFGSKEDAANLGAELAKEINSSYWVSKVR